MSVGSTQSFKPAVAEKPNPSGGSSTPSGPLGGIPSNVRSPGIDRARQRAEDQLQQLNGNPNNNVDRAMQRFQRDFGIGDGLGSSPSVRP